MFHIFRFYRILIFIFIFAELALVWKCAPVHYFHSIAGPYRLDFKRVERCPPDKAPKKDTGGYYSYVDARTHFRQPPTFHMNISSPYDMDDSLLIRVAVSSWSSMGGWKDNAYLLNLKNVCTSWKIFFPDLRSRFLEKIYGEVPDCPLMAGIVRIHNLSVSTMMQSPPGFDQFLYGRWRVDTQVIDPKGDVFSCSRIFVNTVPK